MKLNTDIIKEYLENQYSLTAKGENNEEMTLERPVFYSSKEETGANRVYLCEEKDLPYLLHKDNENLIIYCGNVQSVDNIKGNHNILILPKDTDMRLLFNDLQRIFDHYDKWDRDLRTLAVKEGNYEKVLKISIPIFENQIIINDRDLRIVASIQWEDGTHFKKGRWNVVNGAFVSAPKLSSMEAIYNDDYKKFTTPMIYSHPDHAGNHIKVYRINMFLSERYIGCVSMPEIKTKLTPGKMALFRHFASVIEESFIQNGMGDTNKTSLKSLIRNLVEGTPVDEIQLYYALNNRIFEEFPKEWICLVIRPEGFHRFLNAGNSIHQSYLCNHLEDGIRNAVAFCQGEDIILFSPLKEDFTIEHLCEKTNTILEDTTFRCGISNGFQNIADARLYSHQAYYALQENRNNTFCRFNEIALSYMLSHCSGEFTGEPILSPAMRKLFASSPKQTTDYKETWKVYLDNEMNASQTAKDLHIHRSTLLQRLEYIYKLLGKSKFTPEEKLYMRICLHMDK